MSDTSQQTTPLQSHSASKKRQLSSPLDYCEVKKSLTERMSEPQPVSMEPTVSPRIALGVEELNIIAEAIKGSFQNDLEELVKYVKAASVQSIVDGIVSALQARVLSLEQVNGDLVKENQRLANENEQLKSKIESLEFTTESLEQYSRRNCLRIAGIPENPAREDIDNVILNICKDLSVNIQKEDIDRSHRVGRPGGSKPRAIIVKFTSYRTRQLLYRSRVNLRRCGHSSVFINEDLTHQRSRLLYQSRQLFKSGAVANVWTSDGVILVKDENRKIQSVLKADDLSQFN